MPNMPAKLKVLSVFGTRPEAIKMAPVIKALSAHSDQVEQKICVTAQHRNMLDQVLTLFEIQPDWDLNLMREGQTLTSITSQVLIGLAEVLSAWRPDVMLVHGDTTTSFAASLAAFYSKVSVAHVEAGLRTGDKHAPWPEEVNRSLTAVIADHHFAPTETAAANLRREGIHSDAITVTGNTVIDALLEASQRLQDQPMLSDEARPLGKARQSGQKIILVTGHRRENFGAGIESICRALKEVAQQEDVQICYPVHPNPNVTAPVRALLQDVPNVHLVQPLDYLPFVQLLNLCDIVVTDSGGIQEEAPSLGKPVLVTRTTTERPEAVAAGCVRLVGTDQALIVSEIRQLLHDPHHYASMSRRANPYGDGTAAEVIVHTLLSDSFRARRA